MSGTTSKRQILLFLRPLILILILHLLLLSLFLHHSHPRQGWRFNRMPYLQRHCHPLLPCLLFLRCPSLPWD